MEIRLQISLIICIVAFLVLILYLLKKDSLQLKYTILWMITGLILLLMAIFPQTLTFIVGIVGIYDVSNGLFAMAIFFVLIILLSITSIVSKLKTQNKKLVQANALLEKRVRELEKVLNK